MNFALSFSDATRYQPTRRTWNHGRETYWREASFRRQALRRNRLRDLQWSRSQLPLAFSTVQTIIDALTSFALAWVTLEPSSECAPLFSKAWNASYAAAAPTTSCVKWALCSRGVAALTARKSLRCLARGWEPWWEEILARSSDGTVNGHTQSFKLITHCQTLRLVLMCFLLDAEVCKEG